MSDVLSVLLDWLIPSLVLSEVKKMNYALRFQTPDPVGAVWNRTGYYKETENYPIKFLIFIRDDMFIGKRHTDAL